MREETEMLNRFSKEERIAYDWLESNYERTDSENDLITRDHLFEAYGTHLQSLGEKGLSRNRLGSVIKKVFGELPYLISNSIACYGCLKKIDNDGQSGTVSVSRADDR